MYGSLSVDTFSSKSRSNSSTNRSILYGVLVLCGLCAIAITYLRPVGGRTEMIFYDYKYTDIDPSAQDGGDWMNCMRCRHESSECRSPDPDDGRFKVSAPRTWGYTLPSKDALTNACPYFPGMITVRVRRNGIVRTEWFNKSALLAAVHAPATPNITAPPLPESDVILCVPALPGTTHPWPSASDCQPVPDWTAAIVDQATAAQAAALAADAPVTPGPEEPDNGDSSVSAVAPTDDTAKTPIRTWFNGLVEDVYAQSYGAAPPAPPPEADSETDAAPDDESMADDDGDAPPPPQIQPEDCYGPPSLGCQVTAPRVGAARG